MYELFAHVPSALENTVKIAERCNYDFEFGNIKLQEPRDGRKDRYSAIAYGNYFISLLERNILKDNNENSAEAYKKAFEDVKKYTPPFYVKRKAGFEFI